MSQPPLSTRLTRLFGLAYPILGGGLMWLSDARYVGALTNAGCMGFITPRSLDGEAALREQLRRCSEITEGRPFGVNLTLSARPQANAGVQASLATALAHGVRHFETAGYAPDALIRAIHAAGGIVIHKASSVRHALAAQAAGADAVALVGMEEGGHPGANELPTMLMGALAMARGQFHVPLVLGGGIGHGSQLAAALALGADGVLMGSRFLVSDEVSAHAAYKNHLVDCDEHSTMRLLHTLGNTWRVLRNDTAAQVDTIERAGAADHATFGALLDSRVARDRCYGDGDWRNGMLSLGPAIGFATRTEPLAAIVEQLVLQTRAALAHLNASTALP
ncbi:NAD(P)H-dependent flavin oxidoreductase [Variovorax atrisoli]|uniref:NAD(P)H-dependent flavin oxidoreductase n=1 Tax=Variovorax atrisoli TaxID=3394203 RepID=UPI00162292C1|nr:nitronate monooxygenase [Variovorax sp. BK613]MBB3642159.1 nitronate monooxygenase [Variovorax sp. BK613]